jgi:hypothetical protein
MIQSGMLFATVNFTISSKGGQRNWKITSEKERERQQERVRVTVS